MLGALPSDDAESLRTAFRKAAKATHPDINPDTPDAALRFRELVRAYDILTDAEQRATYDELLAIALQPPPAPPATRTYEVVGKYASNTMAATIISAVLVGGYTLFGLFSKPPGAAEIGADPSPGATLAAFAAALPAFTSQTETPVQREGEGPTDGAIATSAVAPITKEAAAAPIGRFEPVPGFASYNLAVQYYPRFTAAYFDRGIVMYSVGDPPVPTSLRSSGPRIRRKPKAPRRCRASRRCPSCRLPHLHQTSEPRSPRP